MLKLRLANPEDANNWNNFIVGNTPDASFSLYNLFEWKNVLQTSYNYEPYYLIAENHNEIVGCFPLMSVKSIFLGDRLMSLPFTDHGCGPTVRGQDIETLRFLLENLKLLAQSLKNDVIQINSPQDFATTLMFESGYKTLYEYVTFILNLTNPLDKLWGNFKKQVRNSIKKAEKSGVTLVVGDSCDSMERIYAIHLDNMKKLGTPPHSLKFFVEIWKQMRPRGLVQTYLARYDGRDVAGIVLFPHRESVRWGAGVMLTEYRWLNPLYKILWAAICWFKEQGYQTFDMGGSRKDSGNFLFKEAWVGKNHLNGRIVDLYHLHLSLGKHEFSAVSPSNPRYLYLTNLWHSYVPTPVANSFGPYLRRQLAM